MGRVGGFASFAGELYRARAVTGYHGYLRNDPTALLMLRPAHRDPYPIYERLRAAGPITRSRLGTLVTTSHPICEQVLRDRAFGVRPDEPQSPADGLGLSFLELNPPDHTRLRRLAAPAFSPKQMSGYAPQVEKTVHQLIDDLPDGSFDLVSSFAAALPIAVITSLLGVPNTRIEQFSRYGATIGSALDGVTSLRHARALVRARDGLTRIFAELLEWRRRDPADDVVSAIVAAEGEWIIEPAEMVPLCILLLIAGFETTVNLISNGMLALLDNPDQWAALRADPTLAQRTSEEVLRYDSPVQRTARVALHDLDLDGLRVPKGQYIVALLGAANRDPEVYAEPDRFDILRNTDAEHLAFSGGIHYCLGAPLARLEAATAFTAIAERLPTLRRSGRLVRRRAATIRGPLHLPVKR